MQHQMVNIEAEKSQSAQDVNWSAAAVQGQESMGGKNKRQHHQPAQSANGTRKEYAVKQSALALKGRRVVFWRVQDHGFDPASMLHKVNDTTDHHKDSAHNVNSVRAA